PQDDSFVGRRAGNERDREFLSSNERWFRPVQVRTGPDGGLWVVDMYRYVIEHARWIPQATLDELDIFAGRGRGRIYRIVPRDESQPNREWPQFNELSTEQLVSLLDQPNGTVRDLVQQHLVRSARRPQGKLHAMWTLQAVNQLSPDDLQIGLESDRAELVRSAVVMAEDQL
ncbi:MAG: DUF7133 domain-containing protein, partial [Aeoliella sp.]